MADNFFGFARELLDRGLASERSPYGDDHWYDLVIDVTEDIPFYLEAIKAARAAETARGSLPPNGANVLDLGCGTGRMMEALLAEGLDVVGLDLSAQMIETAQRKLTTRFPQDRIRLVQGDMRQYDIERQFDAVIIPYFSMTYMHTDEDKRSVFRTACRHLRPGGIVTFDFYAVNCPAGETAPWLSTQAISPDGDEIIVQSAQMKGIDDNLRLMNLIYYSYSTNGKSTITVESMLESTCPPDRMKALLEAEGFKVFGIYGDYGKAPYDDGEMCAIIARKR